MPGRLPPLAGDGGGGGIPAEIQTSATDTGTWPDCCQPPVPTHRQETRARRKVPFCRFGYTYQAIHFIVIENKLFDARRITEISIHNYLKIVIVSARNFSATDFAWSALPFQSQAAFLRSTKINI